MKTLQRVWLALVGAMLLAGSSGDAAQALAWVCPIHGSKCPWTQHHEYCRYRDAQAAPKGWVCPVHGRGCPWTKSHSYCAYYDQHGYTMPAGRRNCCW